MSEFKSIETQEQLDKIIQERLNRQKESFEKKLSDYDNLKKENASLQSAINENKEKYADYDKKIEELNSKISGYEMDNLKTKIAMENNIPYNLASRLVGDDEESLKADAERLSGYMKHGEPEPPLKTTESGKDSVSKENEAYANMLDNLGLEGE